MLAAYSFSIQIRQLLTVDFYAIFQPSNIGKPRKCPILRQNKRDFNGIVYVVLIITVKDTLTPSNPRGFSLPCYDFIDNFLLFACSLPQINSCCFNAFVSHKVSKQRYVVILVKKILCKTVSERVRINNFRV